MYRDTAARVLYKHLKLRINASQRAREYREHEGDAWRKPKRKEKMQDWWRRNTWSFFTVMAQQTGTLRSISELCKYSQRPRDTGHLSTSASPVSPAHNLSLKQRRADPEGARPGDWWDDEGTRCIMGQVPNGGVKWPAGFH